MTGVPNPTGDSFDIDYVAHEIGHQMGGYHTHNGTGNCRKVGITQKWSREVDPQWVMLEFVMVKMYKIIRMITLIM
jgi:hypothetical protein